MRKTAFMVTLAGITLGAACHSAPPPAAPPVPQTSETDIALNRPIQNSLDAANRFTADSIERARQADLAARARADSLERARLAADKSANLRAELGMMVHFDADQAQIRSEDRAPLDRKVAILNANPDVRLRITGACDDRGSDQYNAAPGDRRAAAVQHYLTDQGIDGTRLEQMSSGEKFPFDSGSGEAAWALNRRAEFLILSGETPLALN